MVIVIGITGATGAIYGISLLEVLSSMKGIQTHLIISEAGETTIKCETGRTIESVKKLATCTYDYKDMGARISSGSFPRDGMIIAPCTIKTMSALATLTMTT